MKAKYIARVLSGVFAALVWTVGLFVLNSYTNGNVAVCWFFILPLAAYFSGYYAVKWAQMIDDGKD